ncbi:subunit of palmitoyl transferase for Lipid A [Escherichia coli]|uniref:Subunit of palmitoyl transferase for Lipid A n=1 Tax=Escherichia coli TaxID=562 RepID=A0A376X355_ECOLX|nr:subunit of palmitoyl transferase for Lipid A [Escherichia coli]
MNVSKYVAIFSFVFIQLISVGKVFANADEWMTTFRENIAQTWQQPEHYDLYIPAITWHARFAYDKEKTDRYNERPWGGGFGLSRWDEKETGMACMPWHLRTRGTNGNRLPDTDGKVPGDRWRMKIFI